MPGREMAAGKSAGILRWPGIDRHLKTGAGSPEEVSDGPTENLYTRV